MSNRLRAECLFKTVMDAIEISFMDQGDVRAIEKALDEAEARGREDAWSAVNNVSSYDCDSGKPVYGPTVKNLCLSAINELSVSASDRAVTGHPPGDDRGTSGSSTASGGEK